MTFDTVNGYNNLNSIPLPDNNYNNSYQNNNYCSHGSTNDITNVYRSWAIFKYKYCFCKMFKFNSEYGCLILVNL